MHLCALCYLCSDFLAVSWESGVYGIEGRTKGNVAEYSMCVRSRVSL